MRTMTGRPSGGSTHYYTLPDKAKELHELIFYKNMNHSIGEAFSALYRLNDNGEKKRNLEKVIYYAKLELERTIKEEAQRDILNVTNTSVDWNKS